MQILDVDGFEVRNGAINRSGAISSSFQFQFVNAGIYRLKASYYSGPNATGTKTGEVSTVVNLCAGGSGGTTATVKTKNSVTPTAIQMFPSSANLTVLQKEQFVATPIAGGFAVFTSPGALTWQLTGVAGDITQDGLLTTTTAGSGFMNARLASPAIQGSAAVDVQPRTTTHAKWTVMVYMNAANDLYSYSDSDVDEMEKVASNPDVRFVVQWKQTKAVFPGSSFDGVRRYLVSPNQTSGVSSTIIQSDLQDNLGNSLDMGNPQTLNDFIAWSKLNYPADRYVLVLWNHGNGWKRSPNADRGRAFSYDDQYGTSIKTWEMQQAMAGQHVDIMAWDCSLMQMLEVAYELPNSADYIAGSEESPPGEGYPYDLVFKGFRDNPDATTATLSKGFVDGPMALTGQNGLYQFRKITQSVLDTTKLSALAASVSTLGDELIANKTALASLIDSIRINAQSYETDSRVYRDLYHICLLFEADGSTPASVKNACADVRAKITAATLWEGHNSLSANSHGIAIDFSSASGFAGYGSDYQRLRFAQDTHWDEYLSVAP